ncbi:MAG TPA: glutamate synthase [Terriglobia bacterium]|nr:glutamate synthase [Terriglobia bacterium]
MAEIDAAGLGTREINREIGRLIDTGCADITVRNPGAHHNLAVAILRPVSIRIAGSVGYYCGGLSDGASIEIEGSAGWGLAESMLNGLVRVHGSAGSGAAAALRGGTVTVLGDAAARLGVSMKGGQVIVAGDCGYMAGFMAQKGTLMVCGNTGEAFADSMYETICYVGGRIASLGTDAVVSPVDSSDVEFLEAAIEKHLPSKIRTGRPPAREFKKVVSGRKLWNFDKRDWRIWQEAL